MDIVELRQLTVQRLHTLIEQRNLPNWWRDLLLTTADADERFDSLPRIAAKNHMFPGELLIQCRTVVVFFIPFTEELINSNVDGKFASDSWVISLSLTNQLIQDIGVFIYDYFKQFGFKSEITPATYDFDPVSLTSRWSHKHLAYLTGLGRFGVNAQIITPEGSAGRLGSLVTEANMGNHPLVTENELCLHKRGEKCLLCMEICPVSAVALEGIDRYRCDKRIVVNRKRFAGRPDADDTVEGCAKCSCGMPCSSKIP